jgi:hypothetical protein
MLVFDVEGSALCGDAVGGCGTLSFDRNLNTLTIVGSIPALGILAPVNLLSGNLSGGVNVLINNGVTGAVTLSGSDTKAPELLRAIGFDPATPFTFFGAEIGVNSAAQGPPYTAISTDIANTQVVPEPGSMALIAVGVAGVAVSVTRRRARRSAASPRG